MRRAASSQNIRFWPLSRAKACSSSRLTAVCTGVFSASSIRSMISMNGRFWNEGASRASTSAVLRWLCGVAMMPCSLPSQRSTALVVERVVRGEVVGNVSWISCRASAAEHGQVLEYAACTPSSSEKWPRSSIAGTLHRIGFPAGVVADQRRPPNQVVEVDLAPWRDRKDRACDSRKSLSRRRRLQGESGFRAQRLVDMQVQARHVDAAHVGRGSG